MSRRGSNVHTAVDRNIGEMTIDLFESYIEVLETITGTYAELLRHQTVLTRRMQTLMREIHRNNTNRTSSISGDSSSGGDVFHDIQLPPHENTQPSSTSTPTNSPASLHVNTNARGVVRRRTRMGYERMPRSMVRDIFRTREPYQRSPTTYNVLHETRNGPQQEHNPQSRQPSHESTQDSYAHMFDSLGGTPVTPNISSSNQDILSAMASRHDSQNRAENMVFSFERLFPIGMYNQMNPIVQPSLGRTFENVPVFPSAEQIDHATWTTHFQTVENPINTSCPITMEPFSPEQIVTQIVHCGHIFSHIHLHSWFRNNVRCPVCRYDIRGNDEETPLQSPVLGGVINEPALGQDATALGIDNMNESSLFEQNNNAHPVANPISTSGVSQPTHSTSSSEQSSESSSIVDALATILIQSLVPSYQTEMRTHSFNSAPLSWSHLIPSVPLMPLHINTSRTIIERDEPSTNGVVQSPNQPNNATELSYRSDDDDSDDGSLSQD